MGCLGRSLNSRCIDNASMNERTIGAAEGLHTKSCVNCDGQSGNCPRATSSSSSCLGWWKLLNIGAIGLRLVGSEKVGAYPSTCQAPRACYRIAPPISKRVTETKSLPRLKGLSTAALRHEHRCENQIWCIFQLDVLIRRRCGARILNRRVRRSSIPCHFYMASVGPRRALILEPSKGPYRG